MKEGRKEAEERAPSRAESGRGCPRSSQPPPSRTRLDCSQPPTSDTRLRWIRLSTWTRPCGSPLDRAADRSPSILARPTRRLLHSSQPHRPTRVEDTAHAIDATLSLCSTHSLESCMPGQTQSILTLVLIALSAALAAVLLSSTNSVLTSSPTTNSSPAMSTTMRAVIHNPQGSTADELRIGVVDRPQVKADHVLIRVKAFGLNRADVVQREGQSRARLSRAHSSDVGAAASSVTRRVADKPSCWFDVYWLQASIRLQQAPLL